jgi:hypothetical protein
VSRVSQKLMAADKSFQATILSGTSLTETEIIEAAMQLYRQKKVRIYDCNRSFIFVDIFSH